MISDVEQRYLLVYEIPAKSSVSKMKVGFRDTGNNKTTYISLNLTRFNEKKETLKYSMGQTIDFKDSTLGNSKLKINSYEIKNKFTLKYTYCTPKNRCVKSVEYLTPNIFNSNYNKSLLKLDASLKLDSNLTSDEVNDLYTLIQSFQKF